MSKKRKAESDQHTTLLDFFNNGSTGNISPVKKRQNSDKKDTSVTAAGSSRSGKKSLGAKGNPLDVEANQKSAIRVPEGVEIIELLDSDEEEVTKPVATIGAGPRSPISTSLPQEVTPEATPNIGGWSNLYALQDARPSFIDCSTFFLDSPTRGIADDDDEVMLIEEEENEREVSARLERMSPEEWGAGDDEGFSDGVDNSTGANEPEEELEEGNVSKQQKEQLLLGGEEEVEEEPSSVQLIELSDDDEPQITSKERMCPVCQQDLMDLDDSEFSSHVNKCLDKAPHRTPTSSAPRKGRTLTPLSSLPVPPHPDAEMDRPDGRGDTKPAKSFNAFSFLMSRNKENEVWKEATEAENSKWGKMKGKGKAKGSASDVKAKEEEIEEIGDDDGEIPAPITVKKDSGKTEGAAARRHAPFYKVMQGMPIAVDAFRYGKIPGVAAYLLTHAHSDHYTNLSASWKHGPIYCSETTANLIIHMLNVDEKWVHPLPMDTETVLPDTGGVKVTLIEANHCPGSCLFMFEGKQTVNAGDSTYHSAFVGTARIFRYLHCGDFRACPQHIQHPSIKGKRLDLIYLDTTYLDPKYCFPPQRMVIDACAELATRIVKSGGDGDLSRQNSSETKSSVKGWLGATGESPMKVEGDDIKPDSVLVVFGTYTIGKERIVKATARALNTLIWCEPRKRAFFECQASLDPELLNMIGDDPLKCGVHVRPLQDITSDRMLEYLEHWKGHWSKVVGMRPTGWTYTPPSGTDTANLANIVQRDQNRTYNWSYLRPMRNSTANVMLYGVPYSEHSSFFELTCFALSVQYVRMIATVNVGSAKSRAKMSSWFEKWEGEKKRREKNAAEGKKDMVIMPRHHEYW